MKTYTSKTHSHAFFSHSMYKETIEEKNNNNISRCQTSLPFNFLAILYVVQMSPFFLAWNLLHNWQLSRQFFISKRRRQKCLPVQCFQTQCQLTNSRCDAIRCDATPTHLKYIHFTFFCMWPFFLFLPELSASKVIYFRTFFHT